MNAPVLAWTPARDAGADRDDLGLATLRTLLRAQFLAEVGWDPQNQIYVPARTHPLLGLPKCRVVDCEAGARHSTAKLCHTCAERFEGAGMPLEEFLQRPAGRVRRAGERLCRVPDCQRPSDGRIGLCMAHLNQRRNTGLGIEEYLALPNLRGFPSFGPCQVAACVRRAMVRREQLCEAHLHRWHTIRRAHPDTSLAAWAAVTGPIHLEHFVIFKGLPERVQLELLVGIQARTTSGTKTKIGRVRSLVEVLRAHGAASLRDLDEARIERVDTRGLFGSIRTTLRRALSTPDTERLNDVWDLRVFGLPGSLDFTGISQPWLRDCAKRWSEHDLPLHRGREPSGPLRAMVVAVVELSDSLRLTRDDRGEQPAALGRQDMQMLTNRLAHRERTTRITHYGRVARCRDLRRFLGGLRALGLTRPDGPAAGLADDVVLLREEVPRLAERVEAGRALPDWVLTIIIDNLPTLEQRSGTGHRRLVELMIDTGRRPDELCTLPWQCLERDSADKPVLVYTNSKSHRPDCRLPISEPTAQIILDQQADGRARFPHTDPGKLALFPRDRTNPTGTEPVIEDVFSATHREFIDEIAHLLTREVTGTDGKPRTETFHRKAVVPYAYRHSYAQRHADHGVAPDVLRDLLSHKSMQTSLGYYRVTEHRVRKAVDHVSAHQFDGSGRRVFRRITGLLAHEHARTRVGQVAVPFGICTEPSNVKAGGQACPYKFTCLGCGHFRSDPSYLPELKSYLQQLLADRERIHAAADLADWARDKLSPSDQEIAKLRGLIRRIEADLGDLNDTDRAQIAEAVQVIRQTRQIVNLGMPSTAPPTTTEPG